MCYYSSSSTSSSNPFLSLSFIISIHYKQSSDNMQLSVYSNGDDNDLTLKDAFYKDGQIWREKTTYHYHCACTLTKYAQMFYPVISISIFYATASNEVFPTSCFRCSLPQTLLIEPPKVLVYMYEGCSEKEMWDFYRKINLKETCLFIIVYPNRHRARKRRKKVVCTCEVGDANQKRNKEQGATTNFSGFYKLQILLFFPFFFLVYLSLGFSGKRFSEAH